MTDAQAKPLHQRVAVVVGGVRGIGGAITTALARDGARVAAVYHRSGEAVPALRSDIEAAGGTLLAVQADVREEASFRASLREIADRIGPIDILVYNAGVSNAAPVIGADLDAMRRVLDVNYWPAVAASQVFLPEMLARRYGRLVFISSVAGERLGAQGLAAYAASKAALNALVRTLAAEISSRGNLTANAVAPGPIRTDLTAAVFELVGPATLANTPAERYGEPGEVADVVAFVASERASFITGQVLYVDGGFANKYVSSRRQKRAST